MSCCVLLLSSALATAGGPTTGATAPAGAPPASPFAPVQVGSNVLQFVNRVPTNLMFISVDTYRKDHFAPHSNLGLTPFLDELAAQSMVMDDHLQCANWTFPGTTCTLAGRSNIDRRHVPRLNNIQPVPDGTPFLASWLGQAGLYSIVVSGNTFLSNGMGNTQGYHENYMSPPDALTIWSRAEGFLSQAIARGDTADGWFLHMHMMEPHAPYEAPLKFQQGYPALDPWPDDLMIRDNHYYWRDQYNNLSPADQALLEAHLRTLYAAEVRSHDHRLEIVWEAMEAGGYLDDTLVVFWNDHGEQFWEHGFQSHAYELYREEVDGFLMFWADNIVPGSYGGPTSALDLVPTLLDLYGLPTHPKITGVPIGTEAPDRARFGEAFARAGGAQFIQKDGYKLHYRWAGSVSFFDRNTDPDELVDLYDPANIDPKALELWNLLRPQIDAMDPLVPGANPQIPPELP